jgi:hypothetical protein
MGESKCFGKNWFKPSKEDCLRIELGEKEQSQLDWWCQHYKESISYLCWCIMEYLEAKDDGDLESMNVTEGLLRACLPYYWEEVAT